MYLKRKPRKDEDIQDAVDLGYWRKANAIHAYFTRNLEDGEEDNLRTIPVRKKDLIELKDRCLKVLSGGREVAADLLPTATGFFFGDTAYSEWYCDDIKDTYDIVSDVLDDWKLTDQVYYFAWY